MDKDLYKVCKQIYGANYVPSYAKNPVDMWGNYQREVIDQELGYAEDLGLNSLRVFLHYQVYKKNHQDFLNRLENFLSLCANHKIKLILILFDGCFGFSDEIKKGYVKGWIANPGHELLGEKYWKDYEKYIKDIVGSHKNDERILLYDIMNEPCRVWIHIHPKNGEPRAVGPEEVVLMGEEYVRFVAHFSNLVRSLQSKIPLTVGVVHPLHNREIYAFEDVLSFHIYPDNLRIIMECLKWVRGVSKYEEKPILITEVGGSLNPPYPIGIEKLSPENAQIICDEVQLALFKDVLPILTKEKIGFYVFQLMVSKITPNHGLIHPGGKKRPVASFLKEYLTLSK